MVFTVTRVVFGKTPFRLHPLMIQSQLTGNKGSTQYNKNRATSLVEGDEIKSIAKSPMKIKTKVRMCGISVALG